MRRFHSSSHSRASDGTSAAPAHDTDWLPGGSGAGRRGKVAIPACCRRGKRKGRYIRHARLRLPQAILALPVAMVKLSFHTVLVAAIGTTPLLEPGPRAASG